MKKILNILTVAILLLCITQATPTLLKLKALKKSLLFGGGGGYSSSYGGNAGFRSYPNYGYGNYRNYGNYGSGYGNYGSGYGYNSGVQTYTVRRPIESGYAQRPSYGYATYGSNDYGFQSNVDTTGYGASKGVYIGASIGAEYGGQNRGAYGRNYRVNNYGGYESSYPVSYGEGRYAQNYGHSYSGRNSGGCQYCDRATVASPGGFEQPKSYLSFQASSHGY